MTRKHGASANADICIILLYEHHIKKENEILGIFTPFFKQRTTKFIIGSFDFKALVKN